MKKYTFSKSHYHLIRKNNHNTFDSECVMTGDMDRCCNTIHVEDLYRDGQRTRLLFSDPSR